MTASKRFAAELLNIKVILECRECHATIGYSPRQWRNIPAMCPNCTHARQLSENSMERAALEAFRVGLTKLADAATTMPYTISIELDGAETDQ